MLPKTHWSTKGTDEVLKALDNAGINTDLLGLEAIVSNLVAAFVASDTFVDTVHAQTGSVREQTVDALNAGGDGPITVTLDFSDQVNEKLAQIPVIGSALPTIAVPGVPVEVMDAQTADSARNSWHWLHIAKQWFGWLGLVFVAIGLLVSYRKRWFFAKVSLAVGVAAGAIWAAMTFHQSADPRGSSHWSRSCERGGGGGRGSRQRQRR